MFSFMICPVFPRAGARWTRALLECYVRTRASLECYGLHRCFLAAADTFGDREHIVLGEPKALDAGVVIVDDARRRARCSTFFAHPLHLGENALSQLAVDAHACRLQPGFVLLERRFYDSQT